MGKLIPVNSLEGIPGPQGDPGIDGNDGAQGPPGDAGSTGAAGPGVAAGGTAGQVLSKIDGADYNTQWVAQSGGISGTLVDAKGDLIVATANDTVARLPIGTDTHVLMADSAQAPGVKWEAAKYQTIQKTGTSLTPRPSLHVSGVGVTTRDKAAANYTRLVVGGAYADPAGIGVSENGTAIETVSVPGANLAISAGTGYLVPFVVSQSIISVDRICFEVTSAGSTAEVGIYSTVGGFGLSLVKSVTGVDVSSTGVKTCVFSTPFDFTSQAEFDNSLWGMVILPLGSSLTVKGATMAFGQQANPFVPAGDFTNYAAQVRTGLTSLASAGSWFSGFTRQYAVPRLQLMRSA